MMHPRKNETGQAAVLLALAMVGLLAFAALAIDGGNAYLNRRNAQNASDAATISGTRALHRLKNPAPGDDPVEAPDEWLRFLITDAAQRNGVPDTNDSPGDVVNDNIEAYYLTEDGDRVADLEVGSLGLLPPSARGIEVTVDIPFNTFLAGLIGRPEMVATTSAGSIYTEKSGSVSTAIWANATDCDPNTVTLNGSHQIIGGGVHSNGDVHINGNAADPSVYTGTMEYATSIQIQNAIIVNPPDNQPTLVPPTVLPPLFDIEEYAPDGGRAVAAGDEYYYLGSGKIKNRDLEDFERDGSPYPLLVDGTLRPGLYFAENEFELNGSLTGLGVTFVAREDFSLSGSGHYLSNYEPELLFFANGPGAGACNYNAIKISASTNVWYGLIYAPYGGADMSNASNTSAYGSIVAYTINLSGSNIEIHYDENVDPPIPPKVILIW